MHTVRSFAAGFAGAIAPMFVAAAAAAVTADPAYIVGAIPLPGVNSADVAVVGTSLAVGQGSFGAGAQSVIRLEPDGTSTTLVTGLNSLGGIAYDAEGDRLLFTDNAGELGGATTGDTVYALASPRTAVGPVAASTLELLPDGTIPFAQAVLPLAGGDILIGDAAGPGAGRVVRLSGGVPTNLITGLDYTAGVALGAGELRIGNVDGSFVGSVRRYTLAGGSLGTLAGGLSGALDHAVDGAQSVLVTGGFAMDFSSTVVRIGPTGDVDEIASGFGFSSGITIDEPSGQVLVLDFGLTRIDTLTPVDGLTPGGSGAKECQVEAWGGAPERSRTGKPKRRWSCSDGDDTCDRDGAQNGECTFLVGACFSVSDPRTPSCVPGTVDGVLVSSTKLPAEAATLTSALAEVLPASQSVCSRGVPVTVLADKKSRRLLFDASNAGSRVDKDSLKLRCLPAV